MSAGNPSASSPPNTAIALEVGRAKDKARAERIEKYYPRHGELLGKTLREMVPWMIATLVKEWPEYFQLSTRGRLQVLDCALTGERLFFQAGDCLSGVHKADHLFPYRDAFDALASQVQEDLAIWRRDEERSTQKRLQARFRFRSGSR